MIINSPAVSSVSKSVSQSDCNLCFDSWSDRNELAEGYWAVRNEWGYYHQNSQYHKLILQIKLLNHRHFVFFVNPWQLHHLHVFHNSRE